LHEQVLDVCVEEFVPMRVAYGTAAAALAGLLMAGTALAQSNYPASNYPVGVNPEPNRVVRGPEGSIILPPQPPPAIGTNASAEQYLQLAQQQISERHKEQAEVALNFAETRMLDRSTRPDTPFSADNAPRISDVRAARMALDGNDFAGAQQAVERLLVPPGPPPMQPMMMPPPPPPPPPGM
jgi:hypothetical protein